LDRLAQVSRSGSAPPVPSAPGPSIFRHELSLFPALALALLALVRYLKMNQTTCLFQVDSGVIPERRRKVKGINRGNRVFGLTGFDLGFDKPDSVLQAVRKELE
jgi:hypothetical protein